MIEIDGVELRTAAQWEKKHRHVKKGQLGKGVERTWRSPNGNTTAMFYNIEQTRPWAKKDVEAVNRRRRADAKAKREADECGRIEGAERGRSFVKIGRFYPSSKTCSACGHRLDALPLSVRSWDCPACGAHHDRDVNAARNILTEGKRILSNMEGTAGHAGTVAAITA